MTVIVICLEGCHGSGKTELVKQFREWGFPVMDEGFLSQPPTLLHPQSLLMETAWVCAWFQRLMTHVVSLQQQQPEPTMTVAAAPSSTHQIVIADRSPLSAIFYSRSDGALLEPLIRQYVRELAAAADVHIVTVHLRTQRDLLWSRITARLDVEPSRAALREDQVEWMDAVLAFYDGMAWDVTVSNGEVTMHDLAMDTMTALAACNAPVRAAALSLCPHLLRAAATPVRDATRLASGRRLQLEEGSCSPAQAGSEVEMTLSVHSDDAGSEDEASRRARRPLSACVEVAVDAAMAGGGAIFVSPSTQHAAHKPRADSMPAIALTFDA